MVAPPEFKGYKPYGNSKHKKQLVDLLYEEYEAIKLADFDLLNHLKASELMGVSRPGFASIYEREGYLLMRGSQSQSRWLTMYVRFADH